MDKIFVLSQNEALLHCFTCCFVLHVQYKALIINGKNLCLLSQNEARSLSLPNKKQLQGHVQKLLLVILS